MSGTQASSPTVNGLGAYPDDPDLQQWKDLSQPGGPKHYSNPAFGDLAIGDIGGYIQWLFHEVNGGGSLVVLHYLTKKGNRKVVLLKVDRPNLVGDEPDWELPGGFVKEGETKVGGAVAKVLLKVGIELDASRLVPVPGRSYIGNRAFFVLNGENEGTSVFAVELTPDEVNAIGVSDELEFYKPKQAKQVSRDALSIAGIGRFEEM